MKLVLKEPCVVDFSLTTTEARCTLENGSQNWNNLDTSSFGRRRHREGEKATPERRKTEPVREKARINF